MGPDLASRNRGPPAHNSAPLLFVYAVPDEAGPPRDFRLAREVDLASQTYSAEHLLAFTLEETDVIGIFYALRNVDTPYLELSLVPVDGQSQIVLRSQSLRTDRQGGGLWEQELPAGSYRLLMNADQGRGTLSVYWGYP